MLMAEKGYHSICKALGNLNGASIAYYRGCLQFITPDTGQRSVIRTLRIHSRILYEVEVNAIVRILNGFQKSDVCRI